MRQFAIYLAAMVLLVTCQPSPDLKITPSFYHWKSTFQPTQSEWDCLDSLNVQKLYVRFFDVDWDEASQQPVPVAALQATQTLRKDSIVPTIFITDRTLEKINLAECDSLARRIVSKIREMSERDFSKNAIPEWQFDCDWTQGTKARYFRLIESARRLLQKNEGIGRIRFSATIRLHQVKFWETTGVPPVERGMLMFYNMGEVGDPAGRNSILDLDIAEQYLGKLDRYPLPLDVALPLFAWAAVYRDGELVFLANNRSAGDLSDPAIFSKKAENQFFVKTESWLDGFPLYAGDFIKIEAPAPGDLEKAADLLAGNLKKADVRSLAFYHLDSTMVRRYDADFLKKICGRLAMMAGLASD